MAALGKAAVQKSPVNGWSRPIAVVRSYLLNHPVSSNNSPLYRHIYRRPPLHFLAIGYRLSAIGNNFALPVFKPFKHDLSQYLLNQLEYFHGICPKRRTNMQGCSFDMDKKLIPPNQGVYYEQQQPIIKAIFSSSEKPFLLDECGNEKIIRIVRHAFAPDFARGAVYDLGGGGV